MKKTKIKYIDDGTGEEIEAPSSAFGKTKTVTIERSGVTEQFIVPYKKSSKEELHFDMSHIDSDVRSQDITAYVKDENVLMLEMTGKQLVAVGFTSKRYYSPDEYPELTATIEAGL